MNNSNDDVPVKQYIEIKGIIFKGKQSIHWNEVEQYIRRYDGMRVRNTEYGDVIRINSVFSDEFVHSNYTRKLRGGLAKTKANLSQIIPLLVETSTNRRWIPNKDEKHKDDAVKGWYRYDGYFSLRVSEPGSSIPRLNYYMATIVVRINDTGNYLYDIINIKKEARKPTDS